MGLTLAQRWHGKPCPYCKRTMNVDDDRMRPTRDHVVPRSKGGSRTIRVCWTCNNLKGDMMPEVWAAFMADNPGWWVIRRSKFAPVPFDDRLAVHKAAIADALAQAAERRARKAAGKPLTGAAKKDLLRRVTRPAVPLKPNGRLIYSTEAPEVILPDSIADVDWPWLRELLAHAWRNGSRAMVRERRMPEASPAATAANPMPLPAVANDG